MLPMKLITFDVTGTLLFFRTPVVKKYLETGVKFGIKIPPEVLERNFKEGWKKLNIEHPNFGKGTGLGWQTWWARAVEIAFGNYVKPEEKTKIIGMTEDILNFYTTRDGFSVRPGTEDLLRFLKWKNVKIGVISNYDPRLSSVLEVVNLNKYFDFILYSYKFGYPKPDRRIFQEALKLGDCSSGSEAIHVGDDVKLDYLGARDAGLRAILMSSPVENLKNDKINKEDVFEDFFKLKQHFQTLPELK